MIPVLILYRCAMEPPGRHWELVNCELDPGKTRNHVSKNIYSKGIVSPMFPSFAMEAFFQKQNMFLLHVRNIFCFRKQCLPYGKTGKH